MIGEKGKVLSLTDFKPPDSDFCLEFDGKPLDIIIQLVRQYGVLQENEEKSLIQQYKDPELAADKDRIKNRLILHNLWLVLAEASKIWRKKTGEQQFTISDFCQQGVIGLSTGIDKFDPDRGYRLSTYCYYWIRQSIYRFIADSTLVRLPEGFQNKVSKIQKAEKRFQEAEEREPTDEELASILEMEPYQVKKTKHLAKRSMVPLEILEPSGDSQPRELEDTKGIRPPEAAIQQQISLTIEELLKTLSQREKQVIEMRFGLGQRTHNLREVGEKVGITRQGVQKIQERALLKLRGLIPEFENLQMLLEEIK